MKYLSIAMLIVCIFSCNQNANTSSTKISTQVNIEVLKASPDNFKLLFENENVRVLDYTLKPGEKDRPHTHPAKSSYVASGGKLKVYLDNGEIIMADEIAGTASWMNSVGKHYVENVGNSEVKIILTEVKCVQR